MKRMRVVIADHEQETRAALGFLLSQEPDINVVGKPGNSQELLAGLEIARPDVVILDCELPGLSTADLLPQLLARDANLKVLILCPKTGREQAAVAAAGARAFVDKTLHPRQLLTALRVVRLESEYE
jgi:DNA-binding NarL/FixJ family response regulator